MSQEKSGESAWRFKVRFKCNRGLNCDTMLTKLDWPCLGASLGILPETRMEQFDLSRKFSSTIDPRRQFTVPCIRTQRHLVSKRPSYYCLIHFNKMRVSSLKICWLVSSLQAFIAWFALKRGVYRALLGSLLTCEFARSECVSKLRSYCRRLAGLSQPAWGPPTITL